MRVLLIGATGVFGARIAARLAHDARFELVIAGRTLASLDRLRSELNDSRVRIAVIDVEASDFRDVLCRHEPVLVIHAAGPFQVQDYRVAEACLACGSDYVDLADGRAFVEGICALDARARDAGCLLISGASTVPALSSAVIDHLRHHFTTLTSIDHAISPGNRTPRGDATVAAILSYCGHRMRVWKNGRWQRGYGWLSTRRERFISGTRWVGLCDVPDLALFPARYVGVQRVTFRAGLELRRLHFGTWLLAWLVRLGLIKNLARHAGRMRRISEWFMDSGTDEGGMVVTLRGFHESRTPMRIRWSLHAAAGDGPHIPAMPAVVLARKKAEGSLNTCGAMPCMGLFDLNEAMATLSDYDIRSELEIVTA